MVGNGAFNYINLRLQDIMKVKRPFGGVHMIVVGDLFQLKAYFRWMDFLRFEKDYGPLALNLWKDHFSMFELTEIMRQRGDELFANLLNRLKRRHSHRKRFENTKLEL